MLRDKKWKHPINKIVLTLDKSTFSSFEKGYMNSAIRYLLKDPLKW